MTNLRSIYLYILVKFGKQSNKAKIIGTRFGIECQPNFWLLKERNVAHTYLTTHFKWRRTHCIHCCDFEALLRFF